MGLLDNDPNLIADLEKHGHFGFAKRVKKLADTSDAGLSAAVDSQIALQQQVIDLLSKLERAKKAYEAEHGAAECFKSRLLAIKVHAHINEEV